MTERLSHPIYPIQAFPLIKSLGLLVVLGGLGLGIAQVALMIVEQTDQISLVVLTGGCSWFSMGLSLIPIALMSRIGLQGAARGFLLSILLRMTLAAISGLMLITLSAHGPEQIAVWLLLWYGWFLCGELVWLMRYLSQVQRDLRLINQGKVTC